MFCVIDRENNLKPIKSGFHTASQANNWAKKNLPKDEVQLWKSELVKHPWKYRRYFIMMR